MSKERENNNHEDIDQENNIYNEDQVRIKDQVEEMIDEAIEEVEGQQEVSEAESLKENLEKEKDKFLRLFAEFENYKRRTSKERVERFRYWMILTGP
jgi:molecular chaperone GrpE